MSACTGPGGTSVESQEVRSWAWALGGRVHSALLGLGVPVSINGECVGGAQHPSAGCGPHSVYSLLVFPFP